MSIKIIGIGPIVGERPTLEITYSNVDSYLVTVGTFDGIYFSLSYDFREQPSFTASISTDADTYELLDGDSADLSEWPVISRAPAYDGVYDALAVQPYGHILNYSIGVGQNVIRLAKNGVVRHFPLMFTYKMTYGVSYPLAILSGTIFSHSHNLIYPAATAPGTVAQYFKIVDGSPVDLVSGALPDIERNPTCWASGWDFSGVPVWNSSGGTGGGPLHGGALITSRHLWEAKHYPSPVGTVFKFLRSDGGGIETRTSIGAYEIPADFTSFDTSQIHTGTDKQGVPNATQITIAKDGVRNSFFGDVRIHVLDSPLPPEVAPFPIIGSWATRTSSPLPQTSSEDLSYADGSTPIYIDGAYRKYTDILPPLVYLDQKRRAKFIGRYVNEYPSPQTSFDGIQFDGQSITTGVLYHSFYGEIPQNFDLNDERAAFFNGIRSNAYYSTGAVSGDSGSPLFVPLSSSTLALAAEFLNQIEGPLADETRLNLMIARADAAAGVSTDLTVTVAPDPTL